MNITSALSGLIALGDPVFNLSVRDNLIGWNVDDRAKRLVNVLDAYVLRCGPAVQYASMWQRRLRVSFDHRKYSTTSRSLMAARVGIISRKGKAGRIARRHYYFLQWAVVGLQSSSVDRELVFRSDRLYGRMGTLPHYGSPIHRYPEVSSPKKGSICRQSPVW